MNRIQSHRSRLLLFLIIFFNVDVSGQHLTLSTYSNQTQISATGSVTLTAGFYIPAGNTVRIFTGASFQDCATLTWTPSTDQNYIRTRVFKVAGVNNSNIDVSRTTCEVNQSVQYIDGLGRPLQSIDVQGSPTFRDVVQPVAYDGFGREVKKYLPYVSPLSSSNGGFKSSAISGQAAFYTDPSGNGAAGVIPIAGSAFSETRFESSPLNRVLEQGAPGVSGQLAAGHTVKLEYGTNNGSTAYSTTGFAVRLYSADAVTTSGQEYKRRLSGTGYYSANELYLTISKDENWTSGKAGTNEEYKDKEGRVVLKRTFTSSETLSTYYVYDDLGNLTFVLPPGANPDLASLPSQSTFDNYCYQYRYDVRQRLIEKKIPGKGWEEMVYNTLDQLVLSRDSLQKTSSQWLFNKYDALGRTVVTGLYDNGSSRSVVQGLVTGNTSLWESRVTTGLGYSNNAFPTSIAYYHSILYYDDYTFPGNVFGSPTGSQASGGRTKGLSTGMLTTVLGTETKLLTITYYDEEGRVVQSKSENHLAGNDVVDNTYNFSGELTYSNRTHVANGATTTVATRYEYDHMGRKKATMASINGQAEVVLSKLDYNELGQLSKKSLHSTDGSSFLQNTKYGYNARGWLKRSISDQFSMKLGYDTLSAPNYNGNISVQEWGSGTSFPNKFSYVYDKINRLTSAVSTGAIMSEVLSYDLMGNISTLNRDGAGIGTYSYTGNKLGSISGGGLTTGGYAYDGNGNATTDGRNGVKLTYNVLNLPATVIKTGLNMAYTYDAAGNKLKKVSTSSATSTRHYLNGIEYNGSSIELIHTEEGIARNNGGTYIYEYNLTDHLGNVRYTFNKHPSLGTVQMLQSNYYYAFGKQVGSTGVNKYLYNGKELQEELGQLDYGARFYDPVIGRFSVIDGLAEEMRSHSPYNYGLNNPLRYTDPDGNAPTDIIIRGTENSSVTIETELIDIEVNASSLGINFGGNHSINGDEILGAALDIVGIFDPTGIADGLNAGLSAKKGDWWSAAISTAGILPLAGDLAKAGKIKKDIKIVEEAIDVAKAESKIVKGEGKAAEMVGSVPKTPKGKGSVGPSERDPKRFYSKKERAEMLESQNGKCAGCGVEKKVEEVAGHHKTRHADGGRSTKENGSAVCETCHVKIHN